MTKRRLYSIIGSLPFGMGVSALVIGRLNIWFFILAAFIAIWVVDGTHLAYTWVTDLIERRADEKERAEESYEAMIANARLILLKKPAVAPVKVYTADVVTSPVEPRPASRESRPPAINMHNYPVPGYLENMLQEQSEKQATAWPAPQQGWPAVNDKNKED